VLLAGDGRTAQGLACLTCAQGLHRIGVAALGLRPQPIGPHLAPMGVVNRLALAPVALTDPIQIAAHGAVSVGV